MGDSPLYTRWWNGGCQIWLLRAKLATLWACWLLKCGYSAAWLLLKSITDSFILVPWNIVVIWFWHKQSCFAVLLQFVCTKLQLVFLASMMLECQWFYQSKAYPHSVTRTVDSFVDPLVVAWLVCGCFRGFHSYILFRDLATLGRVSNCTSHLQWFGHTAKRKLCCVAIQQGRCWIVLVSYVCHFFLHVHIFV